jgi:hypothetical protein
MPWASSALGRVNSDTECTEVVDIEDDNLYAQEGKTVMFAEDAWRQNIPPKMMEYLTNTQHTNLKDHHQLIKNNLGNLKNFYTQILGFFV